MTDTTVTDLTDMSAGSWRVHTLSGAAYLIDLDRNLVIRSRALTKYSVGSRRDSDEASLLEIGACHVGTPMEILIDVSGQSVADTTLVSTAVTQIEQIQDDDADPAA